MARLSFGAAFGLLLMAAWPSTSGAQETPDSQISLPIAVEDRVRDPNQPPPERTIYIPYEEFREIFEKPGRGVFLPYEQFQKLWQSAAAARQPRAKPDQPPVGVLVNEISSEAMVEEDVVRVEARLKVDILTAGWHEIPLRLRDAAIRRAEINDRPGRLLFDDRRGHRLLFHQVEDEPVTLEIELEYAKSYEKSPSRNTVSFESPQAPVNRWKIVVPEQGVQVDVEPLIAASESSGQDALEESLPSADAKQTVLLAFVGAAPEVRIQWTPRSEGAAGLDAIVHVTTEQQVTLEDGVMRNRIQFDYAIRRSAVDSLSIEVPPGQRVTGVFDANVRRWNVETEADQQRVTVDLYQPARGNQSLVIELEEFYEQESSQRDVPVVKALNVERQEGLLVLRSGKSLRVEPAARRGLVQVDPGDLPATLKSGGWTLAYRFSTLPYELVLSTLPVRPRLRADLLGECYLQPDHLRTELSVLLEIDDAGIFQLEFQLPAGHEVSSVAGLALPDATAASVDTFHASENRLVVNFARPLQGRYGLLVLLQRPLDALATLTPADDALLVELPLPELLTPSERREGRLVLYAPPSLRVQPTTTENLRPLAPQEAFQTTPSQRGARFPELNPTLTYGYADTPFSLAVNLQRRRPHISVRQLLTTRVESGVVKSRSDFFYEIRYSPVASLRIDVPESLADAVRNGNPDIREQRMQPQPDDVEEGYVAFQFRGETEFADNAVLRLQWEEANEELEIGGSTTIRVPHLKPRNVDRAWGQIVLTKAEALDLQPGQDASGLRPIDPQHDLMSGATATSATRAFEFHDQWALTVTATRYQLEDVKRTSIDRGLVRMVVTRSDRVAVQALYRVRSVAQRLAVVLPGGVEFDADPLRVNGQPRGLERGEGDMLFIPLSESPEQAVLVELRYTVDAHRLTLMPPHFPAQEPIQSAPAVQKVYLALYLAEEMMYLGADGPWSYDSEARVRLHPAPPPANDHHLVDWVREGTAASQAQLLGFATDGRLHLFSTLRPSPPPDGNLHVIAISRRMLDGLVFGSLGLLGLILVRRSLQTKTVVFLVLVIAVIAIGVFLPTFAQRLLDARFLLAFGLILLVWLAIAAARVRVRPPHTSSPQTTAPENAVPENAVPENAVPENAAPGPAAGTPEQEPDEHPPQSPFGDQGEQPRDASDEQGGDRNDS